MLIVKKYIVSAVMACAAFFPFDGSAQLFRYNIHIDPITSSLIGAQTSMLENVYKKRIQRQEALLVQEGLIHQTLSGIHELQRKTIDYLGNAQKAVKTLRQLSEIASLATTDIPNNTVTLLKEIKDHPQKAALAGITSSVMQQIITEAANLTPLIASLVTSETVKKNADGSVDTNANVNLLNGKERFEVANTILKRLRVLNVHLMTMHWQVRSARIPVCIVKLDYTNIEQEKEQYLQSVVDDLKRRYWSN